MLLPSTHLCSQVGMFWNFSVGGVGQRAIGCPGLDRDFGTVDEPNWPYRVDSSPIFSSPAMNCSKNTYAPEGKPMHQIVDELASDNEYWAEKFLEGWHIMVTNGYEVDYGELVDGPQSAWLGHYSLSEQGVSVGDFENYIAENKPVTFTDPKVRSCKSENALILTFFRRIRTSAPTAGTA